MTKQVDHEQILAAIEDLKTEMRRDSAALWTAVTKLNDEVSAGRGAVRALAWFGGFLIAIGTMTAAILRDLRN